MAKYVDIEKLKEELSKSSVWAALTIKEIAEKMAEDLDIKNVKKEKTNERSNSEDG